MNLRYLVLFLSFLQLGLCNVINENPGTDWYCFGCNCNDYGDRMGDGCPTDATNPATGQQEDMQCCSKVTSEDTMVMLVQVAMISFLILIPSIVFCSCVPQCTCGNQVQKFLIDKSGLADIKDQTKSFYLLMNILWATIVVSSVLLSFAINDACGDAQSVHDAKDLGNIIRRSWPYDCVLKLSTPNPETGRLRACQGEPFVPYCELTGHDALVNEQQVAYNWGNPENFGFGEATSCGLTQTFEGDSGLQESNLIVMTYRSCSMVVVFGSVLAYVTPLMLLFSFLYPAVLAKLGLVKTKKLGYRLTEAQLSDVTKLIKVQAAGSSDSPDLEEKE